METNPSLPDIPPHTWRRPIGQGWDTPYIVRYASNLDDGPWHGAPLGGFGAGCIGRSPRGDFNLWHIDGGEHIFQTFPACQFSIFEQTADGARQAYALCTEPPGDGTLAAWRWYPREGAGEARGENVETQYIASRGDGKDGGENPKSKIQNFPSGIYHALYPRSWFVYQNVFQAELVCEQFSPIWAGNYQETSYPLAVFEWTAHNPTNQPLRLSILLTWQNMAGWFTNGNKSPEVKLRDDGSPFYDYRPRVGESAGNFNQWVESPAYAGCLMDGGRAVSGRCGEGEGQWAIAAPNGSKSTDGKDVRIEGFYQPRWNPVGDGADIWRTFAQDGSLSSQIDETPAQAGEQIGVALALRFTLQPGETRQIPFVLVWDLPVTEFATGIESSRRYTDFFGRDGRNAWAMATTALENYASWRQNIQQWQHPILERPDFPGWFKMALFNELYNLASGGTLWSAASDRDPVGQFAVLECLDYRWYESLDVRLYGGFGLLMLWPRLEKAVIRAFARAIPTADKTARVIGYYFTIGADSPMAVRKAADATPHDLGAPNEHPWEKTNYTSYQDCNQWKDLPSDFVIQVYRAFILTGGNDFDFLADCWSAVVQTLKYLKAFDYDGDGIPENGGAPDQTFDDWKLKGISAYCGGLWLAALEAAIAIGQTLSQWEQSSAPSPPAAVNQCVHTYNDQVAIYQTWLDQARPTYQTALWNGQYYRIDTLSGSDVVMADQLCGQFFARLLDLPDIAPIDCVRASLTKVYDACFIQFNQYASSHSQKQTQKFAGNQSAFRAVNLEEQIGAANGVRPNGFPENPDDTHQLEIWTGINFGLAAFLTQMGMRKEAMTLTRAVVKQIYEHGLQFRTPEAITAVGTFRACHYLRPMAIWSIYGVIAGFD
ncbi:MAG: GH116 family glycosyl hydrolase [Leptolyngbyaceae cyanobacterium MO_188.B28]|nr:GH116 family glycosyl hydrolase [Leptolyngbyaceae cyanobacterium MO_188.B28]